MAVQLIDENDGETKGDMTPMIDIIFLLLIFFILTTKFVPDEKFIASILPTHLGLGNPISSEEIELPDDVNILVYPVGMPRDKQPSWYNARWTDQRNTKVAYLRIGSSEQVEINGSELSLDDRARVDIELDRAHGYVFNELEKREQNSAVRRDEDPVVVHCFSGLPWKYAILVYDAVRDYERVKTGKGVGGPQDLLLAREVNFAPPRIRDYHVWELGKELSDIVHKR